MFFAEKDQAKLDGYADYVSKHRKYELGYPLNHDVKLAKFYEWYLQTKAYESAANNVGNSYAIHPGGMINSLRFEREVLDFLGPLYGFELDNLWGIITFSGTDGNNHGIYFGANYLKNKTKQQPVVYVSDAAHYSNRRLADLQNLDLVLVPSDVHGCMIPEEFAKRLVRGRPALMVYALGTTFKGGSDDMEALNKILAEHPEIEVYRHVDAALFGGYLPYTKYKDAVSRKVHKFDSIAVSGHKFFGLDEPAGIFLTTNEVKVNQKPYDIIYLNDSMPMINCSRSALTALKLWWIIKQTGEAGFAEQANGMLEKASWLKKKLDEIGWPAWLEPMSNTVYFKRPSAEVVAKYNFAPDYDERLGGDLSHLIVMQHATLECLQEFVDDLKALL